VVKCFVDLTYLHRLFLLPILTGRSLFAPSPYVTFQGELVEQKCLVSVASMTLNFLITNLGDDVIPRVDDVSLLVKKRFFLLRYLLPFQSMVHVLIFKGYFIMTSCMLMTSFGVVIHG